MVGWLVGWACALEAGPGAGWGDRRDGECKGVHSSCVRGGGGAEGASVSPPGFLGPLFLSLQALNRSWAAILIQRVVTSILQKARTE